MPCDRSSSFDALFDSIFSGALQEPCKIFDTNSLQSNKTRFSSFESNREIDEWSTLPSNDSTKANITSSRQKNYGMKSNNIFDDNNKTSRKMDQGKNKRLGWGLKSGDRVIHKKFLEIQNSFTFHQYRKFLGFIRGNRVSTNLKINLLSRNTRVN